MTGHLPECHQVCAEQDALPDEECLICRALHAFEQRVEESMDRAWAKAAVEIETHARSSALDAALEAVAALPVFIPDPDGVMYKGGMSDRAGLQVWLDLEVIVSAIDALREKS